MWALIIIVGKTCLLRRYANGYFSEDYIPTVFDNFHSADIEAPSGKFNISLWDTAGHEEYTRLRLLSYPNTDIFFFCFSVVDSNSFRNITQKWIPEITLNSCGVVSPFILVGTKIDLRDQNKISAEVIKQNGSIITYAHGEALAKTTGCIAYIETSSKKDIGVSTLAEIMIQAKEYSYGVSVQESKNKSRCKTQ
jgi:small GTP-binding protein